MTMTMRTKMTILKRMMRMKKRRYKVQWQLPLRQQPPLYSLDSAPSPPGLPHRLTTRLVAASGAVPFKQVNCAMRFLSAS